MYASYPSPGREQVNLQKIHLALCSTCYFSSLLKSGFSNKQGENPTFDLKVCKTKYKAFFVLRGFACNILKRYEMQERVEPVS